MTVCLVHGLVKKCPACGTENSADTFDCVSCRFVLDNVDPTAPVDLNRSAGESLPVDIPPAGPVQSAQTLVCTQPGCRQANPVASVACAYCNEPLAGSSSSESAPAHDLVIEWPWGVESIEDRVVIGREAPATPALAARLEGQFSNVSRQHGYLRRRDGKLVLCDLGSVNGTFVNELRIDAHQEVALKTGDRIRFASRLVATVREAD